MSLKAKFVVALLPIIPTTVASAMDYKPGDRESCYVEDMRDPEGNVKSPRLIKPFEYIFSPPSQMEEPKNDELILPLIRPDFTNTCETPDDVSESGQGIPKQNPLPMPRLP